MIHSVSVSGVDVVHDVEAALAYYLADGHLPRRPPETRLVAKRKKEMLCEDERGRALGAVRAGGQLLQHGRRSRHRSCHVWVSAVGGWRSQAHGLDARTVLLLFLP